MRAACVVTAATSSRMSSVRAMCRHGVTNVRWARSAVADRRERIPDIVEASATAPRCQQAADRREPAADIALVAPSHQVEIGQRQA